MLFKKPTLLRFGLVCLFAFWIGGLSFYSAIVVPVGSEVLGNETEQGFITQRVTNWLNVIGLFGVFVFGLHTMVNIKSASTATRGMLFSWIVLALSQIALVLLHQPLDARLDIQSHSIKAGTHFYTWHRIYLLCITVLWISALGHLLCLVRHWESENTSRM